LQDRADLRADIETPSPDFFLRTGDLAVMLVFEPSA
jgi:hypothetical protein